MSLPNATKVNSIPQDRSNKSSEAAATSIENNVTSFASRTGHRIVFDDSDDRPSILLMDRTGENTVFIDSIGNNIEIKSKGNLAIQVGGNLVIAAAGDITMESRADLNINAKGNGRLVTTGSLDLESYSRLRIDGASQADLKAATVRIDGQAITEIKGGLVKIN